jgi:hypothetical protein
MKTSYKKPGMAVVLLQQRGVLLSGSPDPDNVIPPGGTNVPAGVQEEHHYSDKNAWDDEW